MASVVEDSRVISPYRKLLLQLSDQLTTEDIDKLKLLCVDLIPRWKAENVSSGLEFFDLLEQDARISEGNVTLLVEMFDTVRRMDMVSQIQTYLQMYCLEVDGGNLVQTFNSDEDEVTDGGKEQRFAAVRGPHSAMLCVSPSPPAFNLGGEADVPGYLGPGLDKEEEDGEEVGVNNARVKLLNTSCPTPDQPLPVPTPPRYVDFLECGGYAVKIIGGQHFKTPEGEFVEMKSGVQYKIEATNTHDEGCHLDISIDGYDVGGWVLNGQDELTIERPADEAKKFTFYRVKTAPKEAGIESGRDENGVVRCVFTPEAHIGVSVDVPSLRRSLQIEVPPLATVGDLKRELQRQLNTADDPDQVIVLGNTKLANSSLVRHYIQPPYSENLRLLAAHLEISVEMSSGETFQVKVHPGKSKVRDVMELIENATHVPRADQKLYCGRSCLSNFPDRYLPDELICDPNPKLVAITPEYLHLNLSQDGTIDTIKIDPEKTLRDLLKGIPSCQRLAENQSVELMFEGQCLNPYSDRSLQACNIKTGSTIEVKVKTTCVVRVCLPDDSRMVNITMKPEETFEDLVSKLKKEMIGIELKNVTLAMGDRIFDPERDKAPLKDYGVSHGSFLTVMSGNPQYATALELDRASLDEVEAKERASKSEAHSEIINHQSREVGLFGRLWNRLTNSIGKMKGKLGGMERGKMNGKLGGMERGKMNGKLGGMERGSWSSPRTRRTQIRRHGGFKNSYDSVFAEDCDDTYDELVPQGGPVEYSSMPRRGGFKNSYDSVFAEDCDDTYDDVLVPQEIPVEYSSMPESQGRRVTQKDPAWKAGGTTLQGHSMQLFTPAESLKVDPARKVELLLRLVAREDEDVGPFPQDECKPLSTLYPSPVPE